MGDDTNRRLNRGGAGIGPCPTAGGRTGRSYSHAGIGWPQWLVERIDLLGRCFAVEVYAYCIMSNHFHLVARYVHENR